MRRLFADAAYFIALLLPDDDLADAVDRVSVTLRGATIVATDVVLFELLAHVSRMGPITRRAAVETIREFARGETNILIHVTPELFTRATALYEARPDMEYSLADCLSMIICSDYQISEVLTHDHHFEQEGLTILL